MGRWIVSTSLRIVAALSTARGQAPRELDWTPSGTIAVGDPCLEGEAHYRSDPAAVLHTELRHATGRLRIQGTLGDVKTSVICSAAQGLVAVEGQLLGFLGGGLLLAPGGAWQTRRRSCPPSEVLREMPPPGGSDMPRRTRTVRELIAEDQRSAFRCASRGS